MGVLGAGPQAYWPHLKSNWPSELPLSCHSFVDKIIGECNSMPNSPCFFLSKPQITFLSITSHEHFIGLCLQLLCLYYEKCFIHFQPMRSFQHKNTEERVFFKACLMCLSCALVAFQIMCIESRARNPQFWQSLEASPQGSFHISFAFHIFTLAALLCSVQEF